MFRNMQAFLAQVVGEKAKVALKDFMNFSRGTDAVVKAEWSRNSFARWAAPLSMLVTDVAMGLLTLKPTQFFLRLVFLPPQFDLPFFVFRRLLKRLLTNDKVVRGVQDANVASTSVFLFHWIMQVNRRV